MRAASAYESIRSDLQKAQQDAADLHVENVRLKAQLAALQWTPITTENLPKGGNEVWTPEDGGGIMLVDPERNGLDDAREEAQRWKEWGWTHFRAINTPAPTLATETNGATAQGRG